MIHFSEEVEIKMRPRSRKITVIVTVVCLLNLQKLISQIMNNLTKFYVPVLQICWEMGEEYHKKRKWHLRRPIKK